MDGDDGIESARGAANARVRERAKMKRCMWLTLMLNMVEIGSD